jgi:hypothetical protein
MKKQVVELRSSTPVETDNLAVEHSLARTRRSQFFPKLSERVERVSVTRDKLAATVLNDGEGKATSHQSPS